MGIDRNGEIKQKVMTGLAWKFGERILAQFVSLVVSIILARILAPSDFGAIALIMVFITIANVFVSNGFGSALVQKKDADNIDFSSVFFANLGVSIIIYIIIFALAPYVAEFYSMPVMKAALRVLGIRVIVAAINSVQQAYVSKYMMFQRFFWSTLFGTIFSGVVGIFMAYHGFGVWALVAQYLINTCTDTIVLWVTVKWRPEWIFSWERAKGLIRYGWKMLASGLLDTGYTQLRSLLIGKVYTTEDLAYYNQGDKYSSFVIKNINTSISAVVLPAMSQIQDDRERVKEMTRKSIQVSSYVIWPLMIGVAAVADPFVRVVLTEKWIDCVPYLQVLCFSYALWPIHTSNLQAINALGRSDIFLKLEIIKKIIGIVIIFVSLQFGPYAIAVGCLVDGLVATVINAYPNAKLINYTYWEQLKDIFPSMLLAMIMGAVVYPIQYLKINNACILFVQIVVGGVVYIILSIITKQKTLKYILDTVKQHN